MAAIRQLDRQEGKQTARLRPIHQTGMETNEMLSVTVREEIGKQSD
jgi:hypothetical protein